MGDTIKRREVRQRTDTIAAIAGGLAGLRWRLEERTGGIPREWLGALRGKDLVEDMLRRIPADHRQ